MVLEGEAEEEEHWGEEVRVLLVVLGGEEFGEGKSEELLRGEALETVHPQNSRTTFHSRFRIYKMSLLQEDGTRLIRDCPLPFQRSYAYQDILSRGLFDIPRMLDFFRREGRLHRDIVLEIVRRGIHILRTR